MNMEVDETRYLMQNEQALKFFLTVGTVPMKDHMKVTVILFIFALYTSNSSLQS